MAEKRPQSLFLMQRKKWLKKLATFFSILSFHLSKGLGAQRFLQRSNKRLDGKIYNLSLLAASFLFGLTSLLFFQIPGAISMQQDEDEQYKFKEDKCL